MLECVLCCGKQRAAQKKTTKKKSKKLSDIFYYAHSRIWNGFCSFFSKNAFLGECRGEPSFDQLCNFYSLNPLRQSLFMIHDESL